jgi:hypothetical protein
VLRYGLWVHGGKPTVEQLDAGWKRFAGMERAELSDVKRK